MKRSLIDRAKELYEMERLYAIRKEMIRSRLSEFAAVPPSEYFYELVYCLLTPQSSARNAEQVVLQLRNAEFQYTDVDPEPFLRQKKYYIRFHRTKSRHLLQMKDQFSLIAEKLSEPVIAPEMRDWLVKNVLGLGYKLTRLWVISSIPKSISRKQYLNIEKRFSKFAMKTGIPLDELDLVFWSMETGEIRK